MIVLGIDPGNRNLGYAVIERKGNVFPTLLTHGVFHPGRKAAAHTRLMTIAHQVYHLATKYYADVVAVETAHVGKYPKAALALGQARGAALAGAGQRFSVELVEVTPQQAKAATGAGGRATKDQVRRAVSAIFKLTEKLASDQADAIAIALAGSLMARRARD